MKSPIKITLPPEHPHMNAVPIKKDTVDPVTKPVAKPRSTGVEESKKDANSSITGKGKSKKQRSFRLPEDSLNILKEVSENKAQHGLSREAFVAKAIRVYGQQVLGNAVPASPEDVLEARLDYLERLVSEIAWDSMCEASLGRAKTLRRCVVKTGQNPFSRNFEELKKLRVAKGEQAVDDIAWITAAFAEKFGFPYPEQE